MVLIDSSVWIEFLRRPEESIGLALYSLLSEDHAGIVGIVIAEVLQGARSQGDYDKLRRGLHAARYVEMDRAAWERAGRLAMDTKLAGTPVTLTDLAIAATALEGKHELFTLDSDFNNVPGLRLYKWETDNA